MRVEVLHGLARADGAKLLAATQQLFKRLDKLSSCPARSASPVQEDDTHAEQESQGSPIAQDTAESPAVHDACCLSHGSKKHRLVTVEE